YGCIDDFPLNSFTLLSVPHSCEKRYILRLLITIWELANISQRHFLLHCWLAEPAILSKIILRFRIIVGSQKRELKCF
ncbi:hypothetical protein QUA27_19535, partial [Microcoleus sp. Pol14C6]|uniref:hypothetical protein n=1 Tax=Microcoleus sp. Pol14C6 TaxID=3055399 RepID=UPI002FD62AB1